MQLTYVAVVVLASMIFVLSGMVGYVYWQQTRMLQNLQSLAVVLSTNFVRHHPEVHEEPVHEEPVHDDTPAPVPEEKLETVHEDDRVSVNEVEIVEGPPAPAPVPAPVPVSETTEVVDFEKKTANELKDILSTKGIPFGKRDPKSTLIKLLKATA